MEAYVDHTLHPHGYGLTEEERAVYGFGLQAYTALIRNGYGSTFDHDENLTREMVTLAGIITKQFDEGKNYIGTGRFDLLSELCLGPVFHLFEQSGESAQSFIAKLVGLELEAAREKITSLGAILSLTTDIELTFIDDGLQPGQAQ